MKKTAKLVFTLLQLLPIIVWHSLAMCWFRSLNPVTLSDKTLRKILPPDMAESEKHQWQAVHHGTTSRWRLQLPAQQKILFAKTNPPDYSTRLFGALFQLSSNELGFYRELQKYAGIETPISYGQYGNRYRYVLLLEDLQPRASFSSIKSRCNLVTAESVIDTLASLHASFWQDQRFDQQWHWVNRQQYHRNRLFLELLRQQSTVSAVRRYREFLPEQTRQLAHKINQAYPRLEQAWGQGERTLVHGDAHIGNMYFLEGGKTGLLDWQVIGFEHGMRDVSYFIINSLPTELRQQQQYLLLERYVQRLNERGVDFTMEKAKEQYLLHAPYVWISSAITAASDTMQEKKIAAAGLIRTSRAIVDLNVEKIL